MIVLESVACVASVFVWFQSKKTEERDSLPWPREKSFSWAILTLVPRSLLLAKPHGNACSVGYRIGYKSIKSRIVVRVVTWHYVSTNNKYAKANRIYKSSFVRNRSLITWEENTSVKFCSWGLKESSGQRLKGH